MNTVEKTAYEELFRTCEFKRSDGQGWLTDSETITTAEVLVIDRGSETDMSATMISNVAPYNSTQVRYKLKGGVFGKRYHLKVRGITSNGQKLEEVFELRVI